MEVRSIEAIVRALNEARVKYLIVGGLAVNAHGFVRLTVDVDLVIGLERENIVRGLNALEGIDYHMSIPVTPETFADPALRETWRKEKGMIVLKLWSDTHRRTPVDVFIYEPFAFEDEFSAATWAPVIGSLNAPMVGYDALVAMKRVAGRPQDLIDLAELERWQRLKKEGLS